MATGSRNDRINPDIDESPVGDDNLAIESLEDGRPGLPKPAPREGYWIDPEYMRATIKFALQVRQEALLGGKLHVLEPIDSAPAALMQRSIPVTIYLSESDANSAVRQALMNLLAAFDFKAVD